MGTQNTSPIFTKTPVVSFATLTGNIGLTRSDGEGTIGTDIFKIFTANATNGSLVSRVRIVAAATTPTTMTASLIRLYLSTIAAGATTAADTVLWQEVTVGAFGASNASTAVSPFEVPFGIALAPGMTILASIHANLAANTRWQLTTIAGDY